jgi:hypothetical protein
MTDTQTVWFWLGIGLSVLFLLVVATWFFKTRQVQTTTSWTAMFILWLLMFLLPVGIFISFILYSSS